MRRLSIFGVAFLVTACVPAWGESDVERLARFDWAMQCRGCHGANGENSRNGVPVLAGEVAKFLSVAGGRGFLVQVPGVANAPLSDKRLADLTNWMLVTFDAAHMPPDFVPYQASEVGRLREKALAVEVNAVRRKLRAAIAEK